MPSGAGGRRQAGSRSDNYISWAPQQGARSPSAMPLNKAAAGPKMNGYHGENATGAVNGPLGRNDGVLYGRMPGGENHNHPSLWSGHGQMNMRQGGLGDMRMQGLHALQPPISDDGLVEGIDAMQLGASGGDAGMSRSHRPKLSDGERQEETEDDLFAMYRFKVRAREILVWSMWAGGLGGLPERAGGGGGVIAPGASAVCVWGGVLCALARLRARGCSAVWKAKGNATRTLCLMCLRWVLFWLR